MMTKLKYWLLVLSVLSIAACSGRGENQYSFGIIKVVSLSSSISMKYQPIASLTKRLIIDIRWRDGTATLLKNVTRSSWLKFYSFGQSNIVQISL